MDWQGILLAVISVIGVPWAAWITVSANRKKTDAEAQKIAIESLVSTVQVHTDRAESQDAKINELEAKIDEMKKSLNEKEDEVKKLRNEVKKRDNRITELENEIRDLRDRIRQLEGRKE